MGPKDTHFHRPPYPPLLIDDDDWHTMTDNEKNARANHWGGPRHASWARENFTTEELASDDVMRQKFLASLEGQEAFTINRTYMIESDLLTQADMLANAMTNAVITSLFAGELIVMGNVGEHRAFATVRTESRRSGYAGSYNPSGFDDEEKDGRVVQSLYPSRIANFAYQMTGNRHALRTLVQHVEATLGKQQFANMQWWYSDDGATSSRTVYLPPLTTSLRPEFYPDLGDPNAFIKGYLDSDSSILLMAGEPGTGKTTLLRHMICDNRLAAHIVYDEHLMNSDKVFQSFLFGSGGILIIEDADTILSARELSGNKLMARFLNVSDGLVKLPNKKIVFTTNISDFGRIDPALMRPGRCYAAIHTRPLNLDEAQAAAKVANLPVPVERREYSLAELFNRSARKPITRRIGMV